MSLLAQWRDEIQRFSDLSVYVYYADQRAALSTLRQHDVVLTSYGTLAAEAKHFQAAQLASSSSSSSRAAASSPLFSTVWYRACLDEAHIIRNRLTSQSRACFLLQAERRWTLTGTPIQNRLDDVFPLLHFLREDPWSDIGWWRRVIARPFQLQDSRALQRLKAVLQPLLLRRTKTMRNANGDCILDLPAREEAVLRLSFSAPERDFYTALLTRSRTQVEGYVKEGSILNKYIQVLTLLLRLRQCCDHPFLCIGRGRTEKEWEADVNKFISRFAARQIMAKPADAAAAASSSGSMSVEYIAEIGGTLKKMRKAQKRRRREATESGLTETADERKEGPESGEVEPSPAPSPSQSPANDAGSPSPSPSPEDEEKEEEESWHECPICLSPPQEPVLTEWSALIAAGCAAPVLPCSLCSSLCIAGCCAAVTSTAGSAPCSCAALRLEADAASAARSSLR